jgi:Na+-transporting NADH:ubiquinone oxidoreductase subunit NqrD
MPDFDLEKEIQNGISFRKIFKSIIVYSISIFLGFTYKDLFTEVIQSFMPEGHNLVEKMIITGIVTIVLVAFAYELMKGKKEKIYKQQKQVNVS